MHTVYEFTLRFSLPDYLTGEDAAGALARAGLDDAVAGIGAPGTIALAFDRAGVNMDWAMEQATIQVMQALPGARPLGTTG